MRYWIALTSCSICLLVGGLAFSSALAYEASAAGVNLASNSAEAGSNSDAKTFPFKESTSYTTSEPAEIFHRGSFLYEPEPEPLPANPLFHDNGFIEKSSAEGTKVLPVAPVPEPFATVTPTPAPPVMPFTAPEAADAEQTALELLSMPASTPDLPSAHTEPATPSDFYFEPTPIPHELSLYDERQDETPAFVLAPEESPAAEQLLAVAESAPHMPTAIKSTGDQQISAPAAAVNLYYQGTSYETISPAYNEQSPLPIRGKAMYYRAGLMKEVLAYRLKSGGVNPCSECIGYAALLRAGDINRKVWIQSPSGTVEGPFLVIDVAATHHISSLLKRGWAVDIDYATAMRWGMNRPMEVTIFDSPAAAVASGAR
jgi:hypothetical protein